VRRVIALATALFGVAPTAAFANVIVTATIEPHAVRMREAATLTVSVQGSQRSSRPAVPDVEGLRIQYVGPSSQVSIVNGRISASISHRLVVSASKPGRYEIGPIHVEVEGAVHDAGSVSLEVAAAGAPSVAGEPTNAPDDITLSMTTAETNVFLHQRVPIRVTLRMRNVRVDDLQYPEIATEGVAVGGFAEPRQRRERGASGTIEHVVEFDTTITPLKQGEITVGPATLRMSRAVPSRRPGLFGGGFFGEELRPVEIFADPLTLAVSPLPLEGRPAGFSGAVGTFTMETRIEPLELAVGDPVTVTTSIRGDGSLDGIEPPAIAGDDALRVYPVQAGRKSAGDARSFEQVVIPTRPGSLTLTGPSFSYFDPKAKTYRTLAGRVANLSVLTSDRADASPQFYGPDGTPDAASRPALGRDLVFIKDVPGRLRPIDARGYRSWAFWSAQAVPLVLWMGVTAYDRRRRRLSGDTRYARFTRAGRHARAELARAREAFARRDTGAAHDAAATAIRDYLAAKLDIAPGAVPELAPQTLASLGVADRVIADVTRFFAACEQSRFAPREASSAEIETTLEIAERIVGALESARRLRSHLVNAALVAALALAAAQAGVRIDAHALTAPASPIAALGEFFRGNALYGDERYAEAVAAYEAVLASGVESGALHFNLGNAHFKTGDIGNAILAYERAARLIPSDPDLAANLAYAREISGDPSRPSRWSGIVFPLADRWSSDTLALAAAACWWTMLALMTLGRVAPGTELFARRGAIVLGIAWVVIAASFGQRLRTVELPDRAVITANEEVVVRYQPSPSGTAFFAARPGTVLAIESAREGWYRVQARDGRRGWIEAGVVSRL
jgi:tetratricopeptide (TPR) repeat protein